MYLDVATPFFGPVYCYSMLQQVILCYSITSSGLLCLYVVQYSTITNVKVRLLLIHILSLRHTAQCVYNPVPMANGKLIVTYAAQRMHQATNY